MPNLVTPFPAFERFVKKLILDSSTDYADDLVGGDLAYDATSMDFYVRINRIAGSTDRFGGHFAFDLEVFGADWGDVESRSATLEALLLGYPHVVEVDGRTMVFDDVSQNVGVFELPWEDDATVRLGATYVITARRR